MAVALLLACLLLPGAAQAGPWSTPARFAGAFKGEAPEPAVAVAADGTSVAGWASGGKVVMTTGDRRGRLTKLRAVGRMPVTDPAVAAKPGGRALIAWEARDGIRVAVRTGAGRPPIGRLVADSTATTINELTVAADPRGGWVLAERQFPRGGSSLGYRVRTITLRDDGRSDGPVQELGDGSFGLYAPPGTALRVDAQGRAIFAFERELTHDLVVATRPHGGRFDARVVPGSTEGRILGAGVSVRDDRAVISATVVENCGDAGCFGAPGLAQVGADGSPTRVSAPNLRFPGRALAPQSAALPAGRSAVAFQQKTAPDPFNTVAPARALVFNTQGRPGSVQDLTTRPVSTLRLAALEGGVNALAVWSGARGFGAAAVAERGIQRFRRSAAPPLPPLKAFASGLELAAAGRYALIAVGTTSGVLLSQRSFPAS